MIKSPKPSRFFTNDLMDKYRQTADFEADTWVQAYFEEVQITGLRELFKWLSSSDLSWNTQADKVKAFFQEHHTIPLLANSQQMQRGLAFAQANQEDIALLLGCLSLPYCYAGADGARVLWMSERIRKDTRKRLEETGEFVFGVLNPQEWEVFFTKTISQYHLPNALIRIIKVRLMHAVIRFFTIHYQTWRSDLWGKPVNQEDMAGTNLAFSYMVLVGMRKNGNPPSDEDAEAYLHLWNVINNWMGVSQDLLPQNTREAFVLSKIIAKRQFKRSEEGIGLTKALIEALESFIENPLLKSVPTAFMRFLLGDDTANLLEVPALPFQKRLVQFIPVKQLFPKR